MSLLIKNTMLLDGSGKPGIKADVLVRNDKISAIGNFPKYQADEIIDAFGAYLAPGFIDIHTDSDHYLTLFSNPNQTDFIEQGVTTIIGGHCGVSLAPLLYGSLESVQEWGDFRKININWHTFKEFIKAMESRRLGVNFGTLVGHTTIRESLTSHCGRDLSRNEIRVFNSILEKSLKDGAFGFSVGLGYKKNRQISYNEIKSLAETTAKNKKLLSIHLRNEKRGLLASVNEVIELAKETGVKILISHFRPLLGYSKDYDEALELISKNSDKADVYFDIYPFEASTISVSAFLPEWIEGTDKEMMLKDIETPGLREKILRDFPRLKGDEIIIIGAPQNEYSVGKSLKEFSENRNLEIGEGLLTLMKLTNFRATVFYKNIAIRKAIKSLSHEKAIIASNSACLRRPETGRKIIKPERSYRTFKKVLELAERSKDLSLEKAIYKTTALPAERLNLKSRGLIREGYFADIVVFKDAQIREVILNGKRVVKNGKFQNILAGRIVKT